MSRRYHPISHLWFASSGIRRNARAIREAVLADSPNIRSGNFRHFTTEDLEFILRAYDRLVFGGLLGNLLRSRENASLGFRVSNTLTSTAGTTTRTVKRQHGERWEEYEICIGLDLLLLSFNGRHRQILVNGLRCKDRLDAMLRIFEHELAHLIEFLLYNSSCCKGVRFRQLARRLFGHTESEHELITRDEIAKERIGVAVGSRVSFEHRGRVLIGTLNRITKNASVLVESPSGRMFNDGRRYDTYYVPLDRIARHGSAEQPALEL